MLDSLFDISSYERTNHFIKRCLERFDLQPDQITKFIADNTPVYSVNFAQPGGTLQTRSKNGIVFIINPENRALLTVYPAVDPQVGINVRQSFRGVLEQLVDYHKNMVTRDYLNAIDSTLSSFSEVSNQLRTLPIDMIPSTHINDLYKNTSVIKTTLNLLTKELDYYNSYTAKLEQKQPDERIFEVNSPAEMSFEERRASVYAKRSMLAGIYDEPVIDEDLAVAESPQTIESTIDPILLRPASKEVPLNPVLSHLLSSQDRVAINNFLTKRMSSSVASVAIKSIKAGDTKDVFLGKLKSQMKLTDYNALKDMLNIQIKKATERT